MFSLPIYYPLAYYKGDDKSIDPFEENRQKQVVGLIRTMFLKRFESSVAAFELSCDRLMRKLLAFLEVHSETRAEKNRLERWKHQNAEVLNYVVHRQFELWEEDDAEDPDEDIVPEEFLESVTRLSRDEYEVVEMIQETFLDLDQIVSFLEEAKKFEPRHDDKLKKLIRLLNSKELETRKSSSSPSLRTPPATCSGSSRRPGSRELRRLTARPRAIAPTSFSASPPTTTEPIQPRSVSRAKRRSASSSPLMSCLKV